MASLRAVHQLAVHGIEMHVMKLLDLQVDDAYQKPRNKRRPWRSGSPFNRTV